MNPPPRRLYAPRLARVTVDAGGVPVAVGSVAVESMREEWLVEDRWWTPQPLVRRYFELVLADGRDVVVFADSGPGDGSVSWYLQRT